MPISVEFDYKIVGYVQILNASLIEPNFPEGRSVEFPAVGFEPEGVDAPHTGFVPVERGDPRIKSWVPGTYIKTGLSGGEEYVIHLNGRAQRVK